MAWPRTSTISLANEVGLPRAILVTASVDRWYVHNAHGHTAPYKSNEFSTEGLRAYGCRFGGNGESKYTKITFFTAVS